MLDIPKLMFPRMPAPNELPNERVGVGAGVVVSRCRSHFRFMLTGGGSQSTGRCKREGEEPDRPGEERGGCAQKPNDLDYYCSGGGGDVLYVSLTGRRPSVQTSSAAVFPSSLTFFSL